MAKSQDVSRFVRLSHLYLGVLLAPALLFFALTGAMQTFSLHETTAGSSYKPPTWIMTLAQLHKKQTPDVPVRSPKPPAAAKADAGPKASGSRPEAVPQGPSAPRPAQRSHLPMKIFFLLVSAGLISSTLTGLYMAWKFQRNKVAIVALFVAGIVVPLVLLPF